MSTETPIAMVRCHLDGGEDDPARATRYIPAQEFELWRHLMETKHQRVVTVDAVSAWVPETPKVWDDQIDVDVLEPVLRVRFEKPGPEGTLVPVVRFLPTETYPQAKAALLAHFDLRCRWSLRATPGYFVASSSGPRDDTESDP